MGRYTNIDLSRYSKGYQQSNSVLEALRKKQEAENAVANYGDFNYTNQGAYDSVINDILNRKDFSYDMNADALYQQYKNQYQALGELAMQDTIGQASALTGGYGNSYAVSAGSQAYQSYLNQLNDKIPELWSLARSAYESDRAADYDKYNMLLGDRQTQYGEYLDKYGMLVDERGYYADNYNNAYSQDYTQWADNRNYDQAQYWNEYNAGYQADRDAIADAQWQKQYDENVRQFNTQQAENTRQFNEQMTYKNAELAAESAAAAAKAEIPDYILEKAATFTDDDELANYLNGLESAGAITSTQADSLYANYRNGTVSYANRDWQVTNDGGVNWFWGLDNNAVLSDGNSSLTARELRDALMNEGMSESDANEYLRKLGVYG